MTQQEKFIEAAKKERFCLKYLLPLIKSDKYEWLQIVTPIDGKDYYDVLLMAMDKETKSIVKRFIVEVKVRQKIYEDYIMEVKKIKDIKSIMVDPDATILYISVTPEGTFLYNVNELESKNLLEVGTLHCNKSTMKSTYDKVDKDVYNLKKEWAVKKFDFTFNNIDYLNDIKDIEKLDKIEKNKIDLYNILGFKKR